MVGAGAAGLWCALHAADRGPLTILAPDPSAGSATALAQGWLAAGLTTPDRLIASDPVPEARGAFSTGGSLRTTSDNRSVIAESDVLVLAVKPQSMKALLVEMRPLIGSRHLIISIAAGIPLRQLTEGLGPERRRDDLRGRRQRHHLGIASR